MALAGVTTGYVARPAYAYNCMNAVLRDPYWGVHRRIVEAGGNAASLSSAFARHGFVVDHAPSVGAIMVWPGGYFGAAGSGHVGIVAAVRDDGTVLVRHENWPYGTAEHLDVFVVRPGHQFVHRHDTPAASAAIPIAAPEVIAEADQPGSPAPPPAGEEDGV
jgi:surface antigen